MRKESVLNKIKDSDFAELIKRFQSLINATPEKLLKAFKEHLTAHNNNQPLPAHTEIGRLDQRWYDSLKTNSPDFQVYEDPFYLADIWLCWKVYSRTALLALKAPNALIKTSVVDSFRSTKRILDLGCGFGYTSAGLRELFPAAEVIATNLETSFQFKVASDIGKEHGFHLTGDPKNAGSVDLVFASEYFEHIERPIEHLHQVVSHNRPKAMIIANSFNGHAIGHFNHYKHQNDTVPNRVMSRWFNEAMRRFGYTKAETKIWNNRPSIWLRRSYGKT